VETGPRGHDIIPLGVHPGDKTDKWKQFIFSNCEKHFDIIRSSFMMFPAGDFTILAQNMFEILGKSLKIFANFLYPWH
jgi:hypothetical protein